MLRLGLLGGLRVERGDEVVALPDRRSARLLLAYLALHPGLHARGDLARSLWPDVLESSARTSLRSALTSLRRALEPGADDYLISTREHVGLRSETVSVDIGDAEGELLQGLEADWIDHARRARTASLDRAAATLIAEAIEAGDRRRAIELAWKRVALDPVAEPAHRQLMELLASAGDGGSALAVYRDLSDRLQREMRMAPSRPTRELAQEIRSQQPAPEDAAERDTPPAAVRRPAETPVFGRHEEIDALTAQLGAAAGDGGRVCFLVGPAGVGKTRLSEEVARVAAARGAAVLMGRCTADNRVAHGPLIEAVRDYVRRAAQPSLERETPAVAGELRGVVPELEQRLVDLPLPVAGDPVGEHDRVGGALVETILSVARARTTMVVIDDLHWADPHTLNALEWLVATSAESRLMLLLCYQGGHLERESPAAAPVRRLRRRAAELIELGPLDPDEVGALAAVLGPEPPAAEVIRSLWERSGGNPLFARELVRRALATAGASSWPPARVIESSPLPERVTDVIEADLARLSPAAQKALAVGATAGDTFDVRLVGAVMGGAADDTLDALEEAATCELIVEVPGVAGSYAFRHPLIRATIDERLSATRRADLHRRLARSLQDAGGDDAGALRDIARHLLAAGALVEPDVAARAAAEAAEAAAALHAHHDAAALLEAALERTPHLGAQRARLLIELGNARRRAGAGELVRATFAEAASLARGIDDPGLLARAALGLCSVPFFPGHDPVDQLAVELLEEGLEALPASELGLRARIMAQLARERFFEPDPPDLELIAGESLALARRSRDSAALVSALDTVYLARSADPDPDRRLALAEEIIAVGSGDGRAEVVLRGHVLRGVALLERGAEEEFAAQGQALDELATRLRQPAYRWWPALWRATLAVARGDLDAGEGLIAEAHRIGAPAFREAADLERDVQLLWLARERDEVAQLEPIVAALVARYPGLLVFRCAAALAAVHAGLPDKAAAIARSLDGPALSRLRRTPGWLVGAMLLAEACAELDLGDALHALRAHLAAYADVHAVSGHGSVWLGRVGSADALRGPEVLRLRS